MRLIVFHRNGVSSSQQLSFYSLPETVILKNEKPLFLPDPIRPADLTLHLAVRICNLGKCISPRFAHRYYDALSAVPQFFSKTLLIEAQRQSLPWSLATEFDGAVPIGKWISLEKALLPFTHLELKVDGHTQTSCSMTEVASRIHEAIAEVSRMSTLRRGDVLLIATSGEEISIDINHRVEAYLNQEQVLSFNVK